MTGIELKKELKKINITQEKAAEMMGVTRATLNNWCKQADLPIQIAKDVKTILGISVAEDNNPAYLEIIASQQRIIESLSKTIENLTNK